MRGSPARGTIAGMKRALQVILAIALAGVAFSGYLSYRELFLAVEGCSTVGAPGTILGYPPCIYGLVMYTVVAAVAAGGLLQGRRERRE